MGESLHPEPDPAKALVQACARSLLTKWAAGDLKLDQGPWLCYIGLANICNNRGVICGFGKAMRLKRGLMTRDMFRRIVDELPASASKVYLMKQGEPFLNPRPEEMAAYLRRNRPDVCIAIHTNGILARLQRPEKNSAPDRLPWVFP